MKQKFLETLPRHRIEWIKEVVLPAILSCLLQTDLALLWWSRCRLAPPPSPPPPPSPGPSWSGSHWWTGPPWSAQPHTGRLGTDKSINSQPHTGHLFTISNENMISGSAIQQQKTIGPRCQISTNCKFEHFLTYQETNRFNDPLQISLWTWILQVFHKQWNPYLSNLRISRCLFKKHCIWSYHM